MDVLSTAFNRICIGGHSISLTHDIAIIIESWERMDESLSLQDLIIRPGEFESLSSLYEALCSNIKNVSIIDIMPYIDDYMEYYDNITNKKCL